MPSADSTTDADGQSLGLKDGVTGWRLAADAGPAIPATARDEITTSAVTSPFVRGLQRRRDRFPDLDLNMRIDYSTMS